MRSERRLSGSWVALAAAWTVLVGCAGAAAGLAARPIPARQNGQELRVATAANFLSACRHLGTLFARQYGVKVEVVAGSTGKLYAQIMQGAPFDLFLAADARRPEKLAAEGRGLASSRVTYALGRLVLWAPGRSIEGRGAAVLEAARFAHLALANPETAPYGAAAIATLEHLRLKQLLWGKLVRGEDVGQTFGFIAGKAASLGFVALAQVKSSQRPRREYWLVPANLYPPIEQQAIIVKGGRERQAARFLAYLRGTEGRKIIGELGYGVP